MFGRHKKGAIIVKLPCKHKIDVDNMNTIVRQGILLLLCPRCHYVIGVLPQQPSAVKPLPKEDLGN